MIMIMIFNRNNFILLDSGLGSVYIFSTSLVSINKKWIKYGMSDFSLFEFVNLTIMSIASAIMLISYKSIEIC